MTKAQREKAERLMLKQTLDKNSKLKSMMDALIDNPKPEIVDAVKPVIEEALKKERMIGVNIGWQGFSLSAIEHLKKMNSIEEAIDYFQSEADKVREKFSLKTEETNE